MPKFHLDVHDNYGDWRKLDSFAQGYIQALFFTEMEHGTDSDSWDAETMSSLPGDVTFADLAPAALARIVRDCDRFQSMQGALLDSVKTLEPGSKFFRYAKDALDDERLGMLFWYARNGHGVAFTDDGDHGDLARLQDAARGEGGRDVYFGDDGQVHIMGE